MLEEHQTSMGTKPIDKAVPVVMNSAKGSQEVLIESYVAPAEILEVYQAKVIDNKQRAEMMKSSLGLSEYDKVFKTRSKADTQPKTVLLKRIPFQQGS